VEREPCLWMQTGQDTEGLRSRLVPGPNGRPVKERFPQRGMQGDYDDPRPASGIRFLYFVNDYGNTIPMVLTCGASHLDHTTGFGQYQLSQASFLGYFQPGSCPCALLSSGQLRMHHIVSDDVKNGSPCAPGSFSFEKPCPHSVAEKAARLARSREDYEAQERRYKSSADAQVEQQAKTTELLSRIVEKMADGPVVAAASAKKDK
jgi:hypothetical protein